MSKAQGATWNHGNKNVRKYVCFEKGCDFIGPSGLQLGKHFKDHPEHRTDEQREKWLANVASTAARDRVKQHNLDLEQDRIAARKKQKSKAAKSARVSETAAERRARLDLKNIAQNAARKLGRADRPLVVKRTRGKGKPKTSKAKAKKDMQRTLRNHSMRGKDHKFCTSCGGPRAGTFKFCAHCGYKLL
jgi:hypothetical protein